MTLSGNSLRRSVHTHRLRSPSSKIGSSPLKGCGGNCGPGGKYWRPTSGFVTHVTCRLTAKHRDQLRNPTLGNRIWTTFTFTGASVRKAPSQANLFVCVFISNYLIKINEFTVFFKLPEKFCFISGFWNTSAPKIRNAITLRSRVDRHFVYSLSLKKIPEYASLDINNF